MSRKRAVYPSIAHKARRQAPTYPALGSERMGCHEFCMRLRHKVSQEVKVILATRKEEIPREIDGSGVKPVSDSQLDSHYNQPGRVWIYGAERGRGSVAVRDVKLPLRYAKGTQYFVFERVRDDELDEVSHHLCRCASQLQTCTRTDNRR